MTESSLEKYNLVGYLHEIEKVTDLNGCYFINVENDVVIESTIPFKVPDEILWEIGVLRSTFRQFSQGIQHGGLNELMIEGDKGYILLYDIPPHLLLLAMGSEEINLSYVRLAMIDILDRIRTDIAEIGDAILKIPAKDFGVLGEKDERTPILITATEPVQVENTAIISPIVPDIEPPIKTEIESIRVEQINKEIIQPEIKVPDITPVKPREIEQIELKPIKEQPIIVETPNIKAKMAMLMDKINSIQDKNVKEKYKTLESIFEEIKSHLHSFSGVELYELLESLKDAILLNIGTSLALFDISKVAQEYKKIESLIEPNECDKIIKRINTWKVRIIKN